MKADQSYLRFLKLPPQFKRVLGGASRTLEPVRKVFASALNRLLGTGERLRATLGDDANEI
jgi:hypothetical protein